MRTPIRGALLALFLVAAPAFALQTITPVEGSNSFAKISAKETTRLAIDGGKIRRIIGNDGELVVEKDEERGQLFIKPASTEKPINVRLLSSSGKWFALVLQPVAVPQEDIVLIDADARTTSANAQPDQRSTPHDRSLRQLIDAMADGARGVSRLEVTPVNQEIALWQDSRFVLRARYRDRNWIGERYELTNLGATQMRVVEQELFRHGVAAIAIENLSLDPGQSTFVYVVRGE